MKYHKPCCGITFFAFYHIHLHVQQTLDKVFFGFLWRSSSKTLFHSTSHSSRRKKISTLRVITLRGGRIPPLYESLLSIGNTSALRVTSYSFPLVIFLFIAKTLALRVSTLHWECPCSTSYQFPMEIPLLNELQSSLHEKE